MSRSKPARNFWLVSFFLVVSCQGSNPINQPVSSADSAFAVINRPDERFRHPISFFQEEYDIVSRRRKDATETGLIGLAFSGGGIRSNAFHLGVLSALTRRSNGRLIDRVDYISAVSGGGWAAGAYTRMGSPEQTLALIDQAVSSQTSDFDDLAQDLAGLYLNESYDTLSKLESHCLGFGSFHPGGFAREDWRDMIMRHSLAHTEDVGLREFGKKRFADRPFLVLNASHSAVRLPRLHGYRFEIAESRIAVIDNGDDTGGFVVDLKKSAPEDNIMFSEALAMASAVAPDVSLSFHMFGQRVQLVDIAGLEWYVKFHGNVPRPAVAESYTVTDGGHYENLGVIALMERHVQLIVATDMGDRADQASLENLVRRAHEIGLAIEKEGDRDNGITILRYGDGQSAWIGRIVYINPLRSALFDRALLDCPASGSALCYPYIYSFLAHNYTQDFPHSNTFAPGYSRLLIRAYYALGQFYAMQMEPYLTP